MKSILLAVLAAGVLGLTSPIVAKPAFAATLQGMGPESSDDITPQIEDRARLHQGLIGLAPFAPLARLWDRLTVPLNESLRLELGIAYTTVFQAATEATGEAEAAGGDLDIFGRWALLDANGTRPGFLGFHTETRHRYTAIPPAELGNNTGSLWGTISGFNVQNVSLVELWWEQYLRRDRLGVRAGKIDPADLFDVSRYNSDNFAFFNAAFSDNPAIAFPANSLGAILGVNLSGLFYAYVGFSDANGDKTGSGFDTVGQGEFFKAVELGLSPAFEDRGAGHYHLILWHTDARERAGVASGHGVTVLLEQEVWPGGVPFIRYGYAAGEATEVRHFLQAGVGFEAPFERDDDLLGVGFAWGNPQARDQRDQIVTEIFYRLQLTRYTQVTSGYQITIHPSRNPDADLVGVF